VTTSNAQRSTRKKTTTAKKASPAKKTAASTNGTPSKKTGASRKTSTSKKSTASKKASASRKSPRSENETRSRNGRPAAAKTRSRPEPSPRRIAGHAAEDLLALTGREAEGVTGMERTDDGWAVQIEVLELRRVPTTTDLLALYEVRTDQRGELTGYRRLRRYARGAADDE
jgi:Gas vesicle synthesis protein GvpO